MLSRHFWLACALLTGCSQAEGQGLPALSQVAPRSSAEALPAQGAAPPRVSLAGVARPPVVGSAERPRVYSRARKTWIFSDPRSGAAKLGYLRTGSSVPVVDEAAGTEGCAGGWLRVEPRGFVCLDAAATLDAADPVVALTRESPPDFTRSLPYVYGTVRKPGPVYEKLPSPAEVAAAEPDFESRFAAWLLEPSEAGASYAQHVWLGRPGVAPDPALVFRDRVTDGVPELIAAGNALPSLERGAAAEGAVSRRMRPRAGYSFLRTFLWQGRRYGLTPDLALAPTDRFRPIQGSDFRGVELDGNITFPFAFVRHPKARFVVYQRSTDAIVDMGAAPYRAAVALSGKQNFFRGRLHYETKDGRWLSDEHASRIDPARRMPAWGKNGEKWLDVNLTKQTLVAYDGTRPVYATLISSGEAGLENHEHTTATKRGIFRIHTKHVSSTMSSDEAGEAFELRDVPYVQYFDQGYALHGAYWHDRFGVPKSHGCINLSPEDARRLFFFTEPALPEGWHGVLLPLRGTVLFVHE